MISKTICYASRISGALRGTRIIIKGVMKVPLQSVAMLISAMPFSYAFICWRGKIITHAAALNTHVIEGVRVPIIALITLGPLNIIAQSRFYDAPRVTWPFTLI
jgi:hypothetical protein